MDLSLDSSDETKASANESCQSRAATQSFRSVFKEMVPAIASQSLSVSLRSSVDNSAIAAGLRFTDGFDSIGKQFLPVEVRLA